MQIRPGDAIRVWDHRTKPPKYKIHICVCPERQLFFRVNSEAVYPPHVLIKADECDFLRHDSYIELNQFQRLHRFYLNNAEPLGRCTDVQMRRALIALRHGGWMSEDDIALVSARWGIL